MVNIKHKTQIFTSQNDTLVLFTLFPSILPLYIVITAPNFESVSYYRAALWILRWPTSVTAKAKTSRQKQEAHGKSKKLTARARSSRQKQEAHGKSKSQIRPGH